MTSTRYQVFVSFTKADRTIADKVESALESRGINSWAYGTDQKAGSYAENIEAAIRQCRAFVVVLTANANGSAGIKKEVALAAAKGIPIVPFRPDPAVQPGPGLEYHLINLHMPESIRELVKVVAEVVEGSPPPETNPRIPPPPEPPPPPPPPAVAIDLTGTWQQFPTGVIHTIQQVGNVVAIEARDPTGMIVVMRGQGLLAGNQLQIAYQAAYQPPIVVAGEIRCLVSPDARQISGQAVDQFRGGYLMQLNRVG